MVSTAANAVPDEGVRVLPMGEGALLIELPAADPARVLAVHAALESAPPPGVIELVPAARTVLVVFDASMLRAAAARTWVAETAASARPDPDAVTGPPIVLDVVYDGPDLAETARVLGMDPDTLAARHEAAAWTVAFTGFAPGFAYLVSPDWTFDVPRLTDPRTRVPAGSVALAGGYSGAYPRATPGGWRLIGTTAAPLLDPAPLLAPGDAVRFRRIRTAATPLAPPAATAPPALTAPAPSEPRRITPTSEDSAGNVRTSRDSPKFEHLEHPEHPEHLEHLEHFATPAAFVVVQPGPLTTIQDLGRRAAALGIARSGALDRAALRAANRLVGNPEDAAGLEVTMGGFRARAMRDLWIAATGASAPLRIAGRRVDAQVAHAWPGGAELELGMPARGVRTYLAVRGGIEAPAVVGSRATDTMSGLGPDPLRAGSDVVVGCGAVAPIPVLEFPPWGEPQDDEIELDLAPGPRAEWFSASSRERLFTEVWTVAGDADRRGVRLDGPADRGLDRIRDAELPSEGMVPGAIQVPPSGRPTILLADGPVTGGYPVVAVVADASLDALAQARPGTRIRFRHIRA